MMANDKRLEATDEIGTLHRSFVRMVRGLRERLAMSTFLSQATRDHICGDALDGVGQDAAIRTSLAVLFSDIRQFTDFSESCRLRIGFIPERNCCRRAVDAATEFATLETASNSAHRGGVGSLKSVPQTPPNPIHSGAARISAVAFRSCLCCCLKLSALSKKAVSS